MLERNDLSSSIVPVRMPITHFLATPWQNGFSLTLTSFSLCDFYTPFLLYSFYSFLQPFSARFVRLQGSLNLVMVVALRFFVQIWTGIVLPLITTTRKCHFRVVPIAGHSTMMSGLVFLQVQPPLPYKLRHKTAPTTVG